MQHQFKQHSQRRKSTHTSIKHKFLQKYTTAQVRKYHVAPSSSSSILNSRKRPHVAYHTPNVVKYVNLPAVPVRGWNVYYVCVYVWYCAYRRGSVSDGRYIYMWTMKQNLLSLRCAQPYFDRFETWCYNIDTWYPSSNRNSCCNRKVH